MHELPLVFFTVFTQSAVGAFILLLIGGAMGLIEPRRMAIGLFFGDVLVWCGCCAWHHSCRAAAASAEYAIPCRQFSYE